MNELKQQKNIFFTMVPNFTVDNLSAIPLALYTTIKRVTGKDPNKECYLSERTYMKRLEIGKVALKNAINILKNNNLIYENGKKEIDTSGGPQRVMSYGVNDIDDFNNKHYIGDFKITPLHKTGAPKNYKRYAVLRHKEELIKEERIISTEGQENIKSIKEIINANMNKIKMEDESKKLINDSS